MELKDVLQCSGVKGNFLSLIVSCIPTPRTGLYADSHDLDVPTLLKDVYSDMTHRSKLEADRKRQLDRLEHKVGQALKALGFEGGSDEDAEDEEDIQGESEAHVHSGSSDKASEGEVEGSSDVEGEQIDTGDGGEESRSVNRESDDDDKSTKVSGRGRKIGKDIDKGKAKVSASKGKVKARPKTRGQVSHISTYFPQLDSRLWIS